MNKVTNNPTADKAGTPGAGAKEDFRDHLTTADREGRRKWLVDLKNNEPARKAFKQGEWNKFRIECRGDSIKTWLNGVPAADLKDSVTPSGFIGLQVHGVGKKQEPLEVRFRNLRIKELK